ncbi:MAG: HEAT repeat domain-containing protein [Chloroflexi bacterium]|nr:HEAT repeat domain-containing protein [Chloroflexota bacterium]
MAEKILVVDDEISGLELTELMLQRQGYEVSAANNGREALLKAELEQPDLILLDRMMPDMNGHEVCRRLRANVLTKDILIMMYAAGIGYAPILIESFEAGADDCLNKPAHPAELASRVRALLSRRSRKSPFDLIVVEWSKTDTAERSKRFRNKLLDIEEDFSVRAFLFEEFAAMPDVDFFQLVDRRLNADAVGSMRQMAVEYLAQLNTPEAAVLLMFRLNDREDYVRDAAITALGKLQHPITLPMLASMLNDPRPEKALLAVHVLSFYKSPEARLLLVQATHHAFDEVRKATLEALHGEAIEFPQSTETDQQFSQKATTSLHELRNLESKTVAVVSEEQRGFDTLVKLLSHGDEAVRGTAVVALSILRRQDGILRATLAQDAFWRNIYHNLGSIALESLPQHVGKLSALALTLTLPAAEQNIHLRELVQTESNSDIRVNAVRALGQNRDVASLDLLCACAQETDNSKLVAAALESLGLLGSDKALPVILTALASKTVAVLYAAVNALASLGTPDAVAALIELLQSGTVANRIDTVRALVRAESRVRPDAAVKLLSELCARETNTSVLHSAAQSLGQLSTPEAERILNTLLGHENDHVKSGARKALEALIKRRSGSRVL